MKFVGIPEQLMEVEGSELATAEDTRKVLQDFIQEQLGITSQSFNESTGLERKKNVQRSLSLDSYAMATGRSGIISKAFKLKDTEYKIYEDIPQELLDERKKLLPRKARKEGKRAYFSKAEPDKLIILNGQIYSQ